MIRRIALLCIIALMASLISQAAESAADVLSRSAAACRRAGGISADFTMSAGGKKSNGTIKVSGARYALTLAGQRSVWYDGKTLASYDSATGEATLESPSASEAAAMNPYAIIQSAPSQYKAERLESKNKGLDRIRLTPRRATSGVRSIEVYVDKKSMMPVRTVVNGTDGRRTGIEVVRYRTGRSFTASDFTFPSRRYPKAKVTDLR